LLDVTKIIIIIGIDSPLFFATIYAIVKKPYIAHIGIYNSLIGYMQNMNVVKGDLVLGAVLITSDIGQDHILVACVFRY
ncbi:hypothetical protein ACJX0J_019275, partial [Zea mays]